MATYINGTEIRTTRGERAEFEAFFERVPNLLHGIAPRPPPAAPRVSIPAIPSLEALNAVLVLSNDKLFFVSVSI